MESEYHTDDFLFSDLQEKFKAREQETRDSNDIPCEYDDYAIDESKLLKEPKPHDEVMKELKEKINEIQIKYHGEPLFKDDSL